MVKENSKAKEFLSQTNYIDEIIHLERDNKINQKHDGFVGFFKLASDLKKYNFDKVFIFNSSLRYNLISRYAGIKQIFQYPLFEKQNQHITESAKKLIKRYFVNGYRQAKGLKRKKRITLLDYINKYKKKRKKILKERKEKSL